MRNLTFKFGKFIQINPHKKNETFLLKTYMAQILTALCSELWQPPFAMITAPSAFIIPGGITLPCKISPDPAKSLAPQAFNGPCKSWILWSVNHFCALWIIVRLEDLLKYFHHVYVLCQFIFSNPVATWCNLLPALSISWLVVKLCEKIWM